MSIVRDYDDLYKSNIGSASWDQTLSVEAEAWLAGLVEHVRTTGREPFWSATLTRFAELFPDDAPKTAGTISVTVRRRLNG